MTLRAALKTILQGLLVLPFVLAQFFAQHTMLSDGFEVVLCSSDGPVTLVIGADGVPRPAENHASDCVWAAAPVFDLAALPAMSLAPGALARPADLTAPAPWIVAQTLSRLPEARAPPVLVNLNSTF